MDIKKNPWPIFSIQTSRVEPESNLGKSYQKQISAKHLASQARSCRKLMQLRIRSESNGHEALASRTSMLPNRH
ncbi:hypothetical protein CCACVL1_02492 [Corchorus capsularis]|uniref:Uncharacterized protein n=1 Tax=Corchorus capsularis TaxID=210143 RepID=A0A1R3K857_COCAP|nr:hypothetical protein CCACVL1_02492 [Corchorus capsularis]